MASMNKLITEIRQKLSNDEIEDVIEKLLKYPQENEQYIKLIVYSANLTRIERDFRNGMISLEHRNDNRNKTITFLATSVLDLLEEVDEEMKKEFPELHEKVAQQDNTKLTKEEFKLVKKKVRRSGVRKKLNTRLSRLLREIEKASKI